MPEHDPDALVKTAFAIHRRQFDALRSVADSEERSMGYHVRKAIDKYLGYDKLTVDPLAREAAERAASEAGERGAK